MRQIEIVSHPLCPFAQRLVLVGLLNGLNHGNNFKVTYLPLSNFMGAIREHSPNGESPVLKVDGDFRSTTTEHAAEYIDRITGGKLIPEDPDTLLHVRELEKGTRIALDLLRSVFIAKNKHQL